jgi:short-subunit dehydrogenase
MSSLHPPRPATLVRTAALVTGASTGLGLAIARELLARTEHHLFLTARSSSLERFAEAGLVDGERVSLRPLEVTDSADLEAVAAEVEARFGALELLVNNAGVAYRSVVEHVDDGERRAQLEVNFIAPMELTRRFLPGMRARRHGRIISISSVGGMMAMPTMAVYSASKFALEGACEALWYEVRPWGIHVTLVEPGFIHSDGFSRVRLTRESRFSVEHDEDPYHQHYANMAPFITRIMERTNATPESVARTVRRVATSRRPPLRVPATWDARLFTLLRQWLPRALYHRVLYASLPHIRSWGAPPPG